MKKMVSIIIIILIYPFIDCIYIIECNFSFLIIFFLSIIIITTIKKDSSMDNGTALMKSIQNLHNGDTIGIAIQQDDLPMIQFLLNGEPLHDISINRFRGTVYPSIFIGKDQNDDDDDDDDEEDGNYDDVSVRFVWKEDEFKEMSPSVRFKPLMAAIGII